MPRVGTDHVRRGDTGAPIDRQQVRRQQRPSAIEVVTITPRTTTNRSFTHTASLSTCGVRASCSSSSTRARAAASSVAVGRSPCASIRPLAHLHDELVAPAGYSVPVRGDVVPDASPSARDVVPRWGTARRRTRWMTSGTRSTTAKPARKRRSRPGRSRPWADPHPPDGHHSRAVRVEELPEGGRPKSPVSRYVCLKSPDRPKSWSVVGTLAGYEPLVEHGERIGEGIVVVVVDPGHLVAVVAAHDGEEGRIEIRAGIR